jgi:hypothetical protein
MYDFFKNIAETSGWGFTYGRPDYNNLKRDIEDDKHYLFVDPVELTSSFSDVGNETVSYSGRFMLLLSSDVDDMYEDKYNDYIKPINDISLQLIKDELACSNYQINLFKVLEMINEYDQNFDGVLVNYSFTYID